MHDPKAKLVADIRTAFAGVVRPQEVTRCSYDRRNGGQYGTCVECSDMQKFFQDKDWRTLDAATLRREGQATALFEIDAYVYFLPAFLVAAIEDPVRADVILDHIPHCFGPRAEDEWGRSRLSSILERLTVPQRRVVLDYLRQTHEPERDFDGSEARAIANFEAALCQADG